MQWLLLVGGSLAGGVLSAAARRNEDSLLLRLLAAFVPFACTAGFWYLTFRSGNALAQLGQTFGIGAAGDSSLITRLVTAAATCVLCTLLCKGMGIMLVKYIDTK